MGVLETVSEGRLFTMNVTANGCMNSCPGVWTEALGGSLTESGGRLI